MTMEKNGEIRVGLTPPEHCDPVCKTKDKQAAATSTDTDLCDHLTKRAADQASKQLGCGCNNRAK